MNKVAKSKESHIKSCFKPPVEVKYNSGAGRHITATRDIQVGF